MWCPGQRRTLTGPYERIFEKPREGVFHVLNLFGMIRDDEGAVALEYAVLVGAIVLALVIGAGVFGAALSAWFSGLFPLS